MHTDKIDLLLATEVALFFERNPFTVENGEGVARKLGRHTEQVLQALELLVERCVLTRDENGTLFAYAPPYIAEDR